MTMLDSRLTGESRPGPISPGFFKRALGDLPVGGKLAFGFALAVLVTIGVIATALVSQHSLFNGNEQLNKVMVINERVLRARVAENSFALSRADDQQQEIKQSLAVAVETLKSLLLEQKTPDKPWSGMLEAIDLYQAQFEAYAGLLNAGYLAQLGMQDQARTAAESFELVFLDLLDNLNGDARQAAISSDRLTDLDQTAALMRKLLSVRDREASFILEPDDDHRAAWDMAMADTQTAIDHLLTYLPPAQQQPLQMAKENLEQYRLRFDTFSDSQAESRLSAQKMRAQADQVLALARHASSEEQALMLNAGSRAEKLLLGAAVMAIVVSLLACWVIRRSIVSPLNEILILAKRVAAGRLGDPFFTVARKDELGDLQSTVHVMVASIRGLVSHMGSGIAQLGADTSELSLISAQTQRDVRQQLLETEQTLEAMCKVSATAEQVALNAERASIETEQARNRVSSGGEVVQRVTQQIIHLSGDIEASTDAMRHLRHESIQIGKALDVIKSVSEQTNLLALNAAIEAARAGEQGRGFAVVADEVRALSMSTRESTVQIEQLMQQLQNGADTAVERMESSRALTRNVVLLADHAATALDDISLAIASIDELNQHIAIAAESQRSLATQVALSMTRVREVSESSANVGERLERSSEGLRLLGQSLSETVGKFND
ncbi:Methyl-accepting chemotaxis protein [Pseudomonas syringae pv. primulae]|uniref:Methyl-accepting chemotaxis protein n=4 Tax=Pseudomonas syringae group genomosp. 3 TaxID=251701 RepID=A0A3M3YHC5_9PSED|nr:methyl-accepting chemotaxis protein [Pseudomonas syringae group genomosp. 3]RMO81034.1 Methyl-accepting chemotaxis protein [Pseudomonas syringae pv. primulae]